MPADAGLAPTPGPAPGPADPVVLRSVTKTFGRGARAVHALAGVDLSFPAGRWTAVMGPSGSGKSTLLHCAAGLEPVTCGTVHLAGRDVTALREEELTALRRERLAFVFQDFNLVPSLTARQNVELPVLLDGRRPEREEVRAVLERVGLAERASHRPEQLSGGQRQRVAVARALITHPAVLFADEPTGSLDRSAAAGVLDLFDELVGRGTCLVVVTHDPAVAARAATVLFLLDGRIADRRPGGNAGAVAARLTELDRAVAARHTPRAGAAAAAASGVGSGS